MALAFRLKVLAGALAAGAVGYSGWRYISAPVSLTLA